MTVAKERGSRLYTLKINLNQGALAGVDVLDVTTLLKPDGQLYFF